jgi:hypothetical protein
LLCAIAARYRPHDALPGVFAGIGTMAVSAAARKSR